jgi:F0F1-type ATP synthase assembly protein I
MKQRRMTILRMVIVGLVVGAGVGYVLGGFAGMAVWAAIFAVAGAAFVFVRTNRSDRSTSS